MSTIPTIETYRGVGVHDQQPAERIEGVVRPAIDRVYGLTDPAALFAFAAESSNPPEARLLAAARCEAAWQLAAERRELRPTVDLEKLRAHVVGLNSAKWRDSVRYTSVLDPSPRAVKRETPLARER